MSFEVFLLSLLCAEVQPTSGPQFRDCVMVQSTSPGRVELVGACDVCVTCGKGGLSRSEQLVRYL